MWGIFMQNVRSFYVCSTDWDFEKDYLPIRLYSSLEKFNKYRQCSGECGIMKLDIIATVLEETRMLNSDEC
jgi:hypothetical protein